MELTIILMEPETSGNIGAIARVMKNFDLTKLILINPKCEHLNKEALDRATHAKDILKNAKVLMQFEELKYPFLIGTTSILGNDYNITRDCLNVSDLILPKNSALILGRESSGLTNEELNKCDVIITIPSSNKYPALNISHAASIIFYELYKKYGKNKTNTHIAFASNQERSIINNYISDIIDKFGWEKGRKYKNKEIWKKILGKSFLTRREAFALCGFFKKLK